MGTRIGIDLGTTYSAVATFDTHAGKPRIVQNGFGMTTTPSAICIMPDGDCLWGEEAKAEYEAGNPNAAAFYKRHMGEEGFEQTILGRRYSAADLSALFLERLVDDVEEQLGDKVDGAVITVPAYFAHRQVQATVDAAKRAGINLLSTVHEPTAAAFAYGLDKAGSPKTVLLYDLGGGTFDVTIARVSSSGIDVMGSNGDHQLGGKDWDDALSRFFADQLTATYGEGMADLPGQRTLLQGKAEQLKKQLTVKKEVSTSLYVNGTSCKLKIRRDDFNDISETLCERTGDIIEALFGDLNLSWNDIDSIILVGGSTKMPMIADYLTRTSGVSVERGVNVDEAVAMGAAIKASLKENDRLPMSAGRITAGGTLPRIGFRVSDVVAHSLGMIAIDATGERYVNSIIIHKNTKIPASMTKSHTLPAARHNAKMHVFVLQGEEERPLDNAIVNKYVISGIEGSGSEVGERVDVTYSYDGDGLVAVTAKQNSKPLDVQVGRVPEDMSWTDEPPRAASMSPVLLALDVSGSMDGYPLEEAKSAMRGFVDDMAETGVDVGVLLFADKTKLLAPPSSDYESLKQHISTIQIHMNFQGNDPDGVGCGNLTDPFIGADCLEEGGYLVVLTDGEWENQDLAASHARVLHDRGIHIITIGFGSADEHFLRQVATTDEFASMTDLAQLKTAFGRIAQVIQAGSESITALRSS